MRESFHSLLSGVFADCYFCLRSYTKALMFLVYSYQYNKELLAGGLYRGHHQELIGCYRRACLLVRQEACGAQHARWRRPC